MDYLSISNLLEANDECNLSVAPKEDETNGDNDKGQLTTAPFNQNVSEYTKEQLDNIVQTQIDDIRKAFKSNEQEVIISYGFAQKYKAPTIIQQFDGIDWN